MAAAAGAAVAVLLGALRSVPQSGPLQAVFAEPPYRVEERQVTRGQPLGRILADAGVDPNERQEVLRAFGEWHDPRRIRDGAKVRLLLRPTVPAAHALEVDLDRDRTVRLERVAAGAWSSSLATVGTTRDTVYAAGVVASSLWSAVMSDPVLAEMPRGDRINFIDRLDRVFQWRVDFQRVQVGDTYRFVFARDKRPDGTMRSGHLVAAEFTTRGRAYHAIWFDPNGDGSGSWYDRDGESVRRAFLQRPLKFSRISSRYTNSRFHPILRTWRAHRGVDYAADAGTPVEATADGVVSRRQWSDSYGRFIDIRHANGYMTRYAHLQEYASGVGPGTRVGQGQTIGRVGMTGMATGPHLHYEMHRNGRPMDPLTLDLPPDDPVPAEMRDRWLAESGVRFDLLMTLPGPDEIRALRAQD